MTRARTLSLLMILLAAPVAGCLDAGPDAKNDPSGATKVGSGTDALGTVRNVLDDAAQPVFNFSLIDVGVRALEPTMGVTSTDTIFFIAGTNVLRSRDHGKTWTNVAPNAGGQNVPPTTLDPMLFVDPVTDRVFYNHLYLACTYLAYSDDEGETWIPNPVACGLPGVDHQTIAAGPSALPVTAYQNRAVYLCTNQLADATCSVSLDGGHTFPIHRPLFVTDDPRGCGGITGHVNVAPDGTVYVPAWHCDEPWIAISRDGGLSWEAFRVAPGISSGEMDPSVAVDAQNNVYYFWMDLTGQPYLSTSVDKGRTWSAPLNVSFDGLTVANLPAIVAGDEGRIAFTYIGTTQGQRVNPADVRPDTPWDLYVTVSTDALGATPNFTTSRLNDADKPIHTGPCGGGYRCGAIVDFMDVTMGPDGRVYVSSTDSAGTRNGVLGILLKAPACWRP